MDKAIPGTKVLRVNKMVDILQTIFFDIFS